MNAGVHLDAYPSYRANSVTDLTRSAFVFFWGVRCTPQKRKNYSKGGFSNDGTILAYVQRRKMDSKLVRYGLRNFIMGVNSCVCCLAVHPLP
jgi:hypothetical protein